MPLPPGPGLSWKWARETIEKWIREKWIRDWFYRKGVTAGMNEEGLFSLKIHCIDQRKYIRAQSLGNSAKGHWGLEQILCHCLKLYSVRGVGSGNPNK